MYDYRSALHDDIRNYIEENHAEDIENNELSFDELYEEMWIADEVTGNASGSYTFSAFEAEENLCHNFDLLEEVADEFGIEPTTCAGYEHGAEWWDVAIRCALLGEVLGCVLCEY